MKDKMEVLFEARYGDHPHNVEVRKLDETLHIDTVYPPYENQPNPDNKVRYIEINQEAVRASDGIRVHYDYNRDGFSICQPKQRFVKKKDGANFYYESVEDWEEVHFCKSWQFEEEGTEDERMEKLFAAADAEYEKANSK